MLLLGPKDDNVPDSGQLDYMNTLLQKTFFAFYSNQPLRTIINEVMLKLLGNIPKDLRKINDTGIILQMISKGLGYTIFPSSFIYDTMDFFKSLYPSGVLPSILRHESVPFQIQRLGKEFPSRTIQLIYPVSSPYRKTIQFAIEAL